MNISCALIFTHIVCRFSGFCKNKEGGHRTVTTETPSPARGFHFLSLRQSKGTKVYSENRMAGSQVGPQEQGLSIRGDCVPCLLPAPNNTWQCVKIFLSQVKVATDIAWVEARDAVKHSLTHRTIPTTKFYLSPNVNTTEIKKLNQSIINCRFFLIAKKQKKYGYEMDLYYLLDYI